MRLDEIVVWFETLTPQSVDRTGEFYAPDAYFKDPFNEVRGVEPIRRVFAHMFEQVAEPRFRVTGRWEGSDGVMLAWDFTFRTGGRARVVRGVSHLRFAPDGRIAWHRDYWDAAGELYESVPGLGALMRFLKRRLQA
jgi:ketosteroid isomerase-like protein